MMPLFRTDAIQRLALLSARIPAGERITRNLTCTNCGAPLHAVASKDAVTIGEFRETVEDHGGFALIGIELVRSTRVRGKIEIDCPICGTIKRWH